MNRLASGLGMLLALAVAAYGGYRYAQHRAINASPAQAHTGAMDQHGGQHDGEKQVLYWYDPMYPQQRFDKPGKSPFMDMQLVPKYAGEASSEPGTVSISPNVVQNLGVRIAEAKRGAIEQKLEAVGTVAFNERGVVQLQARAAGFVERLHARAPLDPVAKDAPLVDILFPEWAGAQEEYLLLRRSGSAQLAAAARQRLLLLGMSEAQVEAVERDGKVRNRFTLTAPMSGVIAELGVREGASVMAGQTLFRIVDLSSVWVNAEVPEAQAAWLRPGARAEARVPGYPGQVFQGRVGALLPEVNATTRTVRARIEVANRGALLKPGMFATLQFSRGESRESVLVPSEALIRTGTRNVVIVALGDGRFRAADVEAGFESGGETEIRKGVQAGDKVVLSGQFLLDSEASLSASVSRLEGSNEPAAHKGRGIVTALDAQQGHVELDHEAIASLQWPKMKMGFAVENKAQLQALKKGDAVQFELLGKPNDAGDYVIRRIAPERKK
jgi:membrane fusion protein, copper/silver efflux system